MEIRITHYDCNRCTANGKWPYSTPAGLLRLYYIHSGEGTVYNASKKHVLKAGKMYLFIQNEDFDTVDSCDMEHSFFDFFANVTLEAGSFIELDAAQVPIVDFDLFKELLWDFERYKNSLKCLLEMIVNYVNEEYSLPIATNRLVSEAILIIQKNCAVTVKELTSALAINESHFIRTFKNITGVTPMQYIKSCRITKGINLIKSGMSIGNAAIECGYSSATAFTQAVKSETGKTPKNL
jgi:AraC-like DNA-binding protein